MFLVRVDILMYGYINISEMWGENFDLVIGIIFEGECKYYVPH